ncbi:hypothetical protein VE25_14865 [Devosia geojensis]|uniref:O-antigen ligase-related domain-containing protein n=1 Tax=Devosia geojensis TaxID=443610 RepID=A0A0F5FR80_9HYPH|nr:O-antigen ligase family protein [Devosia geojensis]KKB11060.1 hypothetical protein VE25_14865 [Devosia geojensis]
MTVAIATAERRTDVSPRRTGLRDVAVFACLFAVLSIELLFFYSPRVSVAGVQVRYLLTAALLALALAGIVHAALRRGSLTVNRFHLQLLALVGLIVFNALAVAVLAGNFSTRTAVILFVQPTVLLVALIALCGNRPLRLIAVVLAAASMSSVLAVLQALDLAVAWQVQGFFAEAIPTGYRLDGRVAGLTADPVRLSYISLLGAAISLGLLAGGARRLLLLLFLVNGAATILSGTRSAVVALVVLLALAAFLRVRKADRPAALALIGIGLLIAYSAVLVVAEFGEGRFLSTDDFSSASRGVLLEAALHQIAAMPFGIGFASFAEAALGLDIYWNEHAVVARFAIGTFEPHNYFINFAIYYGVQGVVLIGVFYWLMLRAAQRARVSDSATVAATGRVALYALFSFIVHVLVHNSGPFNGDTSLITVLAPLVAVCGWRTTRSRLA